MGEADRLVIRSRDVTGKARTDGGSFHLVQADELGLGGIAVGVSRTPPGAGGLVHRHSCGEVFVVTEGRGVYTVGDAEIIAEPGDMVVIPPGTWHSFRPDGDVPLRHVAVYDRGQVDIELSTGEVISEM